MNPDERNDLRADYVRLLIEKLNTVGPEFFNTKYPAVVHICDRIELALWRPGDPQTLECATCGEEFISGDDHACWSYCDDCDLGWDPSKEQHTCPAATEPDQLPAEQADITAKPDTADTADTGADKTSQPPDHEPPAPEPDKTDPDDEAETPCPPGGKVIRTKDGRWFTYTAEQLERFRANGAASGEARRKTAEQTTIEESKAKLAGTTRHMTVQLPADACGDAVIEDGIARYCDLRHDHDDGQPHHYIAAQRAVS